MKRLFLLLALVPVLASCILVILDNEARNFVVTSTDQGELNGKPRICVDVNTNVTFRFGSEDAVSSVDLEQRYAVDNGLIRSATITAPALSRPNSTTYQFTFVTTGTGASVRPQNVQPQGITPSARIYFLIKVNFTTGEPRSQTLQSAEFLAVDCNPND